MPRSQRLNRRLQQLGGRLALGEATVRQRLGWAGHHLRTFSELGGAERLTPGFRVLELGSGWHPLVPLAMVTAGAGEVLMCDLEDLSDEELLAASIDHVIASADSGELAEHLPVVLADRVDMLRDARSSLASTGRDATLGELGLVLCPGDVRRLAPDAPPDLFVSNTVLEHIDPPVLVGILEAFSAMSVPGSVMSHLIDTCDHYLYVDDSISAYNFLRFSERQWRLIDNGLQPMNRLRIPQFRELYEAAGVPVTREQRLTGEPGDLRGVPLAPPFDTMDPADVACLAAWFDTVF